MKRLSLLLLFLGLTYCAFAANPWYNGFTLSAGFNANYYRQAIPRGSYDTNTNHNINLFGPFVSLGYEINFSNNNSIITGLTYTHSSGSFVIVPGPEYDGYFIQESNHSLKKDYIDIPVHYQHLFNISPSVGVYFNAGTTFSYWLSFSETYNVFSTLVRVNHFDSKSKYNRFNIAVGGEVGLSLFSHIRIGAGFNYYLVDYFTSEYIKWYEGYLPNKLDRNLFRQLRLGLTYVF